MKDHPKPCDEPWHPSELEDYNHARNDDERRRMLLLFGYDESHRQDAERLFAPPPEPEVEPPSPLERIELELIKQTEQTRKYHAIQEADQSAQRKQSAADRRKTIFENIIVGILCSTIAGLILYYWPEIIAYISDLFS